MRSPCRLVRESDADLVSSQHAGGEEGRQRDLHAGSREVGELGQEQHDEGRGEERCVHAPI